MCHFEHLSALKFFNGCVTMYCVSLRGNPICFESALNGCWHAFFHMLKKPNYITLYASIQGPSKLLKLGGALSLKALQRDEIQGIFHGFVPKNRGCTCTPGTPSSYGPELVRIVEDKLG